MIVDLTKITYEEIKQSAQRALENGLFITDKSDYYAKKMCEINLSSSNCAKNNNKTILTNEICTSIEPQKVKVKKKIK